MQQQCDPNQDLLIQMANWKILIWVTLYVIYVLKGNKVKLITFFIRERIAFSSVIIAAISAGIRKSHPQKSGKHKCGYNYGDIRNNQRYIGDAKSAAYFYVTIFYKCEER